MHSRAAGALTCRDQQQVSAVQRLRRKHADVSAQEGGRNTRRASHVRRDDVGAGPRQQTQVEDRVKERLLRHRLRERAWPHECSATRWLSARNVTSSEPSARCVRSSSETSLPSTTSGLPPARKQPTATCSTAPLSTACVAMKLGWAAGSAAASSAGSAMQREACAHKHAISSALLADAGAGHACGMEGRSAVATGGTHLAETCVPCTTTRMLRSAHEPVLASVYSLRALVATLTRVTGLPFRGCSGRAFRLSECSCCPMKAWYATTWLVGTGMGASNTTQVTCGATRSC